MFHLCILVGRLSEMGSLKIQYLLVTLGGCNGKSTRIEEVNNLEFDLTKPEKFI